MIRSLPLFHRIDGQPVIVLGEGAAAEAKRRLVERAGARVVTDEDAAGENEAGARLAFVALDDPDAAAQRLRARGLLVNVADRPDLCDFTLPSILDRDPVLIAVGTGGASAGLAKALRLRLDALLPASLGALADALLAARARIRQRWPDGAERRRALDAALDAGAALDPLDDEAAARVGAWVDAAGGDEPSGSIHELRLRSPDPDDLTLREARLLGRADVIAHEAGIAPAILDRARADAVRLTIENGATPPPLAGLVVVLRT